MSQPERARLTIRRAVDPDAAEAFLSGRSIQEVAPAAPAVTPAPIAVVSAPVLAPVVEMPRAMNDAAPATKIAPPISALAGRRVHERKDGRRVRRTTVLLGEELARRVDLFAAANGVDKTVVMQDALERWLAERGA